MSESLPITQAEAVSPSLRAAIIKDFYLGIRFAQGNDTLHALIVLLLRANYQINLPDAELAALYPTMDDIEANPPHFKVPEQHKNIGANADVFQTFWAMFRNNMRERHSWLLGEEYVRISDSEKPEDYTASLLELGEYMVNMDNVYIYNGRPNAHTPQAAVSSQFREFVLEGRRTRSAAFDNMFADLRIMAMNGAIEGVDELAASWSEKNPGQEFYPASYLADLAEYRAHRALTTQLHDAQQLGAVSLSTPIMPPMESGNN